MTRLSLAVVSTIGSSRPRAVQVSPHVSSDHCGTLSSKETI